MSGSNREIKGVPCDKRDFKGSQSGNSTADNAKRALEEAAAVKKKMDEQKK